MKHENRRKLAGIAILAACLVQGCGSESETAATLTATGSLTVGDERIELGHATLDPTRTGLILTLTDRALPEHCTGALSALALFEADQRISAGSSS